MKQKTVILTVAGCIAAAALLAGAGIVQGMRMGASLTRHQEKSVNTENYTLEKTKLDAFSKLDIYVQYAEVNVIPSDGFYLEYNLNGDAAKPEYGVSQEQLTFREGKRKQYRNFFGWSSYSNNLRNCFVNLYVPKEQYFEWMRIYNESGSVSMEAIKAGKLNLNVEYGNLTMESYEGEELTAELSSGRMDVDRLKADSIKVTDEYGSVTVGSLDSTGSEFNLESGDLKIGAAVLSSFYVDNDYGNVKLDSLECEAAVIKLGSGDLKVEEGRLTGLEVENEYGSVEFGSLDGESVKANLESGDFEIGTGSLVKLDVRNEYGSVELGLKDLKNNYDVDLVTEYGDIRYDGAEAGITDDDDDGDVTYSTNEGKDRRLTIYCESGSIEITERK